MLVHPPRSGRISSRNDDVRIHCYEDGRFHSRFRVSHWREKDDRVSTVFDALINWTDDRPARTPWKSRSTEYPVFVFFFFRSEFKSEMKKHPPFASAPVYFESAQLPVVGRIPTCEKNGWQPRVIRREARDPFWKTVANREFTDIDSYRWKRLQVSIASIIYLAPV